MVSEGSRFRLERSPVHLGLGATVIPQPPFSEADNWYERYSERHGGDGAEGRLVSMYTFDESWDTWEVHPEGHELVVCVTGTITLHQEIEGVVRTITLQGGEATINPPGVWHTADVTGMVTACSSLRASAPSTGPADWAAVAYGRLPIRFVPTPRRDRLVRALLRFP